MPFLAFGPGSSALISFDRWTWKISCVVNDGSELRQFQIRKDRMLEHSQDTDTIDYEYMKMNV